MLAVVVRELSKHQGAFLFDCCVFIARFASSSCYSSAKTRIRPVKSYQDIMESHDDSYNKVLCLFSMFVMNYFDEDEAQYEHKWGGSPPGRKKNLENQVPLRNWKNNISVEKLQHIWTNSLRGDSVYQE